MQDIADAAGVSQSTVSRVLTGAPNAIPINPATRERILEVARQMRYRPNPLARGLRGARGSVSAAHPARIPTMQDIADAAGVSQSTV